MTITHKFYTAIVLSERSLTRWLSLASIIVLLVGCGSVSTRFVSGLTTDERVLAAQLPVYRERLPEGSYEFVDDVNGLSCQLTHDDQYAVSEKNAIEEIQRATFKTGANAVMGVQCNILERGQGTHRCFHSIECHGRAVLIEPTNPQ